MSEQSRFQRKLKKTRCKMCPHRLTGAEVEGINLHALPLGQRSAWGPKVSLLVRCRHCRLMQWITAVPDKEELFVMFEEVYRKTWRDVLAWSWSRDRVYPQRYPWSEEYKQRAKPRPSRRWGMPKGRITDEETERFLRILHRASMKRSTKSFQRWLHRFTGE